MSRRLCTLVAILAALLTLGSAVLPPSAVNDDEHTREEAGYVMDLGVPRKRTQLRPAPAPLIAALPPRSPAAERPARRRVHPASSSRQPPLRPPIRLLI